MGEECDKGRGAGAKGGSAWREPHALQPPRRPPASLRPCSAPQIAINFHILCMDQQQRGRGAMLPGMPPAEALPEPTAASAAQDSSAAASRAPEAGP